MKNFDKLSMQYKNAVNNQNNQGGKVNKKHVDLHIMKHNKQVYESFYEAEIVAQMRALANESLFAENLDLEMYLEWLNDDEFTGSEKR